MLVYRGGLLEIMRRWRSSQSHATNGEKLASSKDIFILEVKFSISRHSRYDVQSPSF